MQIAKILTILYHLYDILKHEKQFYLLLGTHIYELRVQRNAWGLGGTM